MCEHLPPNENIVWTETSLKEEALKYSSRSEFSRNNTYAYRKAISLGILDQVCQHMSTVTPSVKRDRIFKIAGQYKTKKEFFAEDFEAYKIAVRNGYIDEACAPGR